MNHTTMLVYAIIIAVVCVPINCHPVGSQNRKGDPGSFRHERIAPRSNTDEHDQPGLNELDLWLSDFENGRQEHKEKQKNEEYDYQMQADAPMENRDNFENQDETNGCVSLDEASNGACVEPQCSSDLDCTQRNHKCCFNGCVHVCSRVRKPAPLIDWIVQPKPRNPGSSAWLVGASTHNDDSELAERDGQLCILNGLTVAEGEHFRYENHICHCRKKQITCRVASSKTHRP